MALTYLGLVNTVLTRLNEVNLTSADFATESGFHSAVREAVNAAIFQINHQHYEWPFNFAAGSQLCTAGTYEYTLPVNCKTVDWESFYVDADLLASPIIQARFLDRMDTQHFRQTRLIRNLNDGTMGRNTPQYVARAQNNAFVVSPVPDQAYTIKFDYWMLPVKLALYNDTTTIPDIYEEVVINGAMFYTELFRQNYEVAASYKAAFDKGVNEMRMILIPAPVYARDTRYTGGAVSTRQGF